MILRIDDDADRKKVAGILAENSYSVVVKKKIISDDKFFAIAEKYLIVKEEQVKVIKKKAK